MRKYIVAAMATGWIGIGFAAGTSPDEQFQQYSAQGRAYMTYDFGGPRRALDAPMPFHYGLRVDSESRIAQERFTGLTDRRFPPMLQMDFAADGTRIASLNGIPFAGRSYLLRQNDGSPDSGAPAAPAGEPGGFTWFDWSLLAVGVGGLGYIISEVAKGKDSPDPPSTTTAGGTTTGGGTNLGTVTGVVTGAVNTVTGAVMSTTGVTGVVTGAVNTVTGALMTFTSTRSVDGILPFDPVDHNDPSYQKWLDGGHGQMGDLGG